MSDISIKYNRVYPDPVLNPNPYLRFYDELGTNRTLVVFVPDLDKSDDDVLANQTLVGAGEKEEKSCE